MEIENTVISGGYCIGCGACASVDKSPFKMRLNDLGQYEPGRTGHCDIDNCHHDVSEVCPFSNSSTSEDTIASDLFASECRTAPHVGHFLGIYAGYVSEGNFRTSGSSGGMGVWIGHELLKRNMVDFVVSVGPVKNNDQVIFSYNISKNCEELRTTGKSRYYPVEMSTVLRRIRENPGRYAIVGTPCFIKAVRLLQKKDPVFHERICFCIGLVCGHLKSAKYADNLAWQLGVPPGQLRQIDFRTKMPDRPADQYGVTVSDGKKEVVSFAKQLFGTDWGAGAFKYKACDFCDDVFAETADIVLGDAWLPRFVKDSGGTSIVVVRSRELNAVIDAGRASGRLVLCDLSPKEAALSQAGGLRHRRDALSYRLATEQQKGAWVPRKRLQANSFIFARFERIRQDARITIRELSHASHLEAVKRRDWRLYDTPMQQAYAAYKSINAGYVARAFGAFRRLIRRIP